MRTHIQILNFSEKKKTEENNKEREARTEQKKVVRVMCVHLYGCESRC